MLDELKGLGVDVDEGIARLTGNPAFYEKMLFRFPEMLSKSSVDPDFDCNDYGEVIELAQGRYRKFVSDTAFSSIWRDCGTLKGRTAAAGKRSFAPDPSGSGEDRGVY